MGMINELIQYHPLIADIDISRRQREELCVYKFLFGLSIPLQPLRGQFLTGENGIPTLQKVFSRISQAEANAIISTSSTKTLFSETSALYSFVDRGSTKGHGLPPRGRGGSCGCGAGRGVSMLYSLPVDQSHCR